MLEDELRDDRFRAHDHSRLQNTSFVVWRVECIATHHRIDVPLERERARCRPEKEQEYPHPWTHGHPFTALLEVAVEVNQKERDRTASS